MKTIEIGGIAFEEISHQVLLDPRETEYEYGRDYFDEYEQRAKTEFSRVLHRHRYRWVTQFVGPDTKVCDFGCGYGVNVVNHPNWLGWDVNPLCRELLGNKCDDRYWEYDAVCLFDVLEHLSNPLEFVEKIKPGAHLFVVVPCYDSWGFLNLLPEWKHWKPGEHLLYASQLGLVGLLCNAGFEFVSSNCNEKALGRQDVMGFVFRKPL